MAVDVLRSKGVPEDHILFLNLIASPEGAANFAQKFPKVRIVTAFVDQGLNEKKYVLTHASTSKETAKETAIAISYPASATSATGSTPYSPNTVDFKSKLSIAMFTALDTQATKRKEPSSTQYTSFLPCVEIV